MIFANLIGTIIVVVLIPILILFLGGPILIKLTGRYKMNTRFVPVGDFTLPRSVEQFFTKVSYHLTDEGFDVIDTFIQSDFIEGQMTYVRLFANYDERMLAICATVIQQNQEASFIEFRTEFNDKTHLLTNNAPLGVFKPMPRTKLIPLIGFEDIRFLYKLHCITVNRWGRNKEIIPLTRQGAIDVLQKSISEVFEWQKHMGLLGINQMKQNYYPTWYGAFYMTWRLIEPIKSLLEMRAKKDAESIIKSVGLWTEYIRLKSKGV